MLKEDLPNWEQYWRKAMDKGYSLLYNWIKSLTPEDAENVATYLDSAEMESLIRIARSKKYLQEANFDLAVKPEARKQ